jgi:hypothetical protein
MADAHSKVRSLATELSTANYQAKDLPNLARNVYVRCLLKVHSASGGRTSQAKGMALAVTANVLKQLVGFHFTTAEVQQLLDEEEQGEQAGDTAKKDDATEPKPTRGRAKG